MTARLSTGAEAALMFIRDAGCASVSRSGVVYIAARPAPFLFAACQDLERAGLVERRPSEDPALGRLTIHPTAEGATFVVSPPASMKARSWGRRYED
jgi:hypothetical protein